MKKKSFSLVSNGYKLLAFILTLCLISLTITFIVFLPIWYAILFSTLASAFCFFALILCFRIRIVVDRKNNQLFVYNIKSRRIDLHTLRSIEVDTKDSINDKKYCFIIFKLNDGSFYKTGGYSTIITYKAVFYTHKIVNELLNYLKN